MDNDMPADAARVLVRLREVLGWEPEISLEEGLARTYEWIEAQVAGKLEVRLVSATS